MLGVVSCFEGTTPIAIKINCLLLLHQTAVCESLWGRERYGPCTGSAGFAVELKGSAPADTKWEIASKVS